jgi:hypothetical protein
VLGHVDVVFALTDKPKADALAVVPFKTAAGASCRLVLYPISILDNEARKTSPQDFGIFKQTVAHEMFHCFTAWNYPAHWTAGFQGAYDVLDWWLEGAAEYFSNVVYPATNDEWLRMDEWKVNSATTSVVFMTYDNFGFFQYLGNVLGNNGLLSLLAKTPTSGDEVTQAVALAAHPGMEGLFHDYARSFMDGKIQDSAGAGVYLSTTPVYVPPEYRLDIAAPEILHLSSPPFVLMRYGLIFKQGRQYMLAPVLSGAPGLDASRPRDVPGAWTDLPPKVTAACDEVRYFELVTSTTESASDFDVELTITTEEGAACDKCLIGTWDLNIPSFTEYSEAPFAETPGLYQFDAAGGLWRFRFRADGTMKGEFDFFYTYSLHQEGGDFGADIVTNGKIDIDGTGEGNYLSDGLSNLTFTLAKDSVSLTDEIYINGQKVDASMFGSMSGGYGYAGADNTIYSCDIEAGILLINVAPQANLPPIQYDRVSTDPNKP